MTRIVNNIWILPIIWQQKNILKNIVGRTTEATEKFGFRINEQKVNNNSIHKSAKNQAVGAYRSIYQQTNRKEKKRKIWKEMD